MNKDVALVLSSGGPRGFAYIGAIEELESRGYNITSVAGCSIGSLVGGVYAAGGLDGFKEWLFDLDNAKLLSLLDVSISKSYLMKGDKVIDDIKAKNLHDIAAHMGNVLETVTIPNYPVIDEIKKVVPEVNIEDLRIPYRAVATDLYTGEEVVFSKGKLFDAIRASISIPSLFRPVKYGYHTLIDGGVVNTMPLSRAVRNGHDILVAFDVNHIDSEKIASYLKELEDVRAEDIELKSDALDAIGDLALKKGVSLLDRVRMIGDEAQKAYKGIVEIGKKTRQLEDEVNDENIPTSDNYYSILTRTFSLMNHTIARQSIQLYKPDIVVKMTFDTYGAIPDYAKGEEIAAEGRELMSAALDEYERAEDEQNSVMSGQRK